MDQAIENEKIITKNRINLIKNRLILDLKQLENIKFSLFSSLDHKIINHIKEQNDYALK